MENTVKAWKVAEEDLDLEVESPFYFNQSTFPIFVKYFGTNIETIIIDIDDIDTAGKLIPEQYYWSGINPINYGEYEREHFINTLKDWGWFGPDSKKS